MAGAIQFAVELLDNFTPSSRGVTGALDNILRAMKRVDHAGDGVGDALKRIAATRLALTPLAESVRKLGFGMAALPFKVASKAGEVLSGGMSKLRTAAVGAAKSLGANIWTGIGHSIGAALSPMAIAGYAMEMGKAVVSIYDFNRATEAQFAITMRSTEAAKGMVDTIRKFSMNTGIAKDDLASWTAQLSEAGLKGDVLQKTLLAMGDLQTMGSGFNAGALIQAQKQMREMAKGGQKVISGADLERMFAATGFDSVRLAKALGAKGKTDFELIQQLKMSTFKLDGAMEGILRGVQDSTGKKLGGLSVDVKAASMEGIWNRAQMSFERFVTKMDTGQITKPIERLVSFFMTPEVSGAFEKLFGMYIKAFGWVLGALGVAVEAIIKVTMRIPQALSDMWTWIKSTDARWGNIGSSIVEGIWSGLKKQWASLVERFKGLADMLPEGVRKVLGIASPSRVMAVIGGQTVAGFGVGAERAAGSVFSGIAQSISDGASSAFAGLSFGGGGGSVSNDNSKTSSNTFNISMNGGSGSGGGLDESAIERALVAAFGRAMVASGGTL